MSSIRVPDTITKMDPADTYPVVNGEDVGGFVDLRNELNDNTSKIEANILNIKSLVKAGKTHITNNKGDTFPAYDTEQHGNYLIIQRGQAGTIVVPTPNPTGGVLDGTILTIYNESPSQAVRLVPGDPSDFVNSASAVNIPPENFASFVYQLKDRNFLELESGYIPIARINLANFVEQKLKADGNLVTLADIDAAGYVKGIKSTGDGNSTVNLSQWLHFDGATVSQGKPGQAVVTIPQGQAGAPGVNVKVNDSTYQGMTTLDFKDFSASVSANDPKMVILTPPAAPKGIELDDGVTNAASIVKINLKGMKITEPPNQDGMAPDEVQVTAGLNWHMMEPDSQYGSGLATEVIVEPPLNTYADPDDSSGNAVKLGIKHGYFELAKAPGYLAYLADNEDIVGKTNPTGSASVSYGQVWFNDVIVPAGSFIPIDRTKKTFGLQDIQIDGDPNLDGGTNWLVAYRIALKGTAPDDGFVRIYLFEEKLGGQPSSYLTDSNGNPMAVERHYKAGDKLGVLDVMGIVNAKGLRNISMHVEDNFTSDVVQMEDRTEGASGIMLQALTSTSKTGPALLQFEADTGQNIEFSSHYLGASRASLDWVISRIPAPSVGAANTALNMIDGWGLHNLTPMKFGSENGYLLFQDNGSDLCDFDLHRIFGAEETAMMAGKQISVTVTLVDQYNAFNVSLVQWTGKGDAYDDKIFTSRSNGSIVMGQNWSVVDTLFAPEDVTDGEHTVSKTFTVPGTAKNYGVMIYPVESEQPMKLQLKQLKVDVVKPFIGFALHYPEYAGEYHLQFSDEYAEFRSDMFGFASIRYTLNNSADGLPMPAGTKRTEGALIELDTSVNKVPSSNVGEGEGALKVSFDGSLTLKTTLNLWSEKSPEETHTVTFWWAKMAPDGTWVKQVGSVSTFQVQGGTQQSLRDMLPFTIAVQKGDTFALRSSADVADGAFLQCNSNTKPLVTVKAYCEQLQSVGDDPYSGLDLKQFEKVYPEGLVVSKTVANVNSVTIPFDVSDTMDIVVLGAVKQMADGSVRPVVKLDWVYSNTNKTLTVSFGETVLIGRILIGVYA